MVNSRGGCRFLPQSYITDTLVLRWTNGKCGANHSIKYNIWIWSLFTAIITIYDCYYHCYYECYVVFLHGRMFGEVHAQFVFTLKRRALRSGRLVKQSPCPVPGAKPETRCPIGARDRRRNNAMRNGKQSASMDGRWAAAQRDDVCVALAHIRQHSRMCQIK